MVGTSIRHSQGIRLQKRFVALTVTILVGVTALVGTAEIHRALYRDTVWNALPIPLLLGIAAWFSLWLGTDLYQSRAPRNVWQEVPSLVASSLQLGGLMLVLLVAMRANIFSVSLVGILVSIAIPSRIAVRVLPYLIIRGLSLSPPSRVLIVGSGQIAQLVAASLLKYDAAGTTVLGFIDDHSRAGGENLMLRLPTYDVECLERLITAQQVTHVVFAFSSLPDSVLVQLMRICQGHPDVEISLIPRFYEAMSAHMQLLDVHGLPLLRMPARRQCAGLICKAVVDRALAGAGLVLCAPLLALAALAIRGESPGPVLFRQPRVGRGGQLFTMYKLRSMRAPLPGDDIDGPSRYTGVGALLRKYGIDELPQLWNVLRGEMSLVGPRPEREEYVRLFSERIPVYQQRHRVRGGITGLAQIKGLRGATSIVERTRIDIFYVENWSLWLDLRIILMTFRSLIPVSQGINGDSMFLDLVTEVSQHRGMRTVVDRADSEMGGIVDEAI